ncbi:hypothetical protein [uncultured Tateyamaria sp.]|uniref:hypothetical protein n=1 Tax=uncultured Tateyamaria sp. TaxID=455651 RepID=UPI00262049D7|nr:hypothetical protein [uncultured Tateyamaria sp.]
MALDEIEAVLAHYVDTGGSKELQSFDAGYSSLAKGGSEATRRGDVELEPIVRSKSVLQ